jgi:hypothetical protein
MFAVRSNLSGLGNSWVPQAVALGYLSCGQEAKPSDPPATHMVTG